MIRLLPLLLSTPKKRQEFENILLWYNIRRRRTNINIINLTFQKGNWNIFLRNFVFKLVLKYLTDVLNIARRGHPGLFLCCNVTCGASHAMFIVTCGETSDPHPRGVNITRPCRALSLPTQYHPPQTFHSPLYMKILLVLMKPSTGLFVETWFSHWRFSGRKGGQAIIQQSCTGCWLQINCPVTRWFRPLGPAPDVVKTNSSAADVGGKLSP